MTENSTVYMVEPSFEDGRPAIAFDLPRNKGIDWHELDEILLGQRPITDYREVSIVVPRPDATSWEYFSVPGTLGLISTRAVDCIGRSAFRLYDLLPAKLNRSAYFFLKPVETMPCLDWGRSDVVMFSCDPTDVKDIKKFAFKKSLIPDPLLFSIPELPDMFATPGIHSAVVESGMLGFRFVSLD